MTPNFVQTTMYILITKKIVKEIIKMRRTLEGTKRKRQNVSGFRARMATPAGRATINRRRSKGRHAVSIVAKKRA